jgi:hypothetical protein
MKLILKDGFIYVVNSVGLANNKVVAEVVTKYVDSKNEYTYEYRINKQSYQPLKTHIEFDSKDYENGYINLSVKATHEVDKTVKHYKADRIPVTFAVIFGETLDKAYPEVIRHILDRLDRMDIVLTNVIDAMAEVDKKGDLF